MMRKFLMVSRGGEENVYERYPTHKSNWIGHIFRINLLIYNVIQGQMAHIKAIGIRRKITHYLMI